MIGTTGAGKRRPLFRSMTLLTVFLLGDVPADVASDPMSIDVVYQAEKTSHREVFEALNSGLSEWQGAPDAIRLRTFEPGEKPEPGVPPPDLVITIGVESALSAYQRETRVPILSTLIPRIAYRELTRAHKGPHTGIVLDQPLERQLAVARALMPDAKRVGLLRSENGTSAANISLDALFGLEIDTLPVGTTTDSVEIISRLIANNDVIITTFDPKVYSPGMAKWLLYLAFQRNRPIVGFSSALLEAGAAASVYSTPEQIGRQAAELVTDWLQGGPVPRTLLAPRYYHVAVNVPVAFSLGLGQLREEAIERTVSDLLEWIP